MAKNDVISCEPTWNDTLREQNDNKNSVTVRKISKILRIVDADNKHVHNSLQEMELLHYKS